MPRFKFLLYCVCKRRIVSMFFQPLIFEQSQLFKRHKDPRSETRFAFYTTVVDNKGHNKVCYLKPESGVIVAEESSTPDGYHYFLMKLGTEPWGVSKCDAICFESSSK